MVHLTDIEQWGPLCLRRTYHNRASVLQGKVAHIPEMYSIVIAMTIHEHNKMASSHGNIFRVTGTLWGKSNGPKWIPSQSTVTRSFDAFFDLRPGKRLSKQSRRWWGETPSLSLWRRCNDDRGSNYRQLECLLNPLFRLTTKKTRKSSALLTTCVRLSQSASIVESVSMSFPSHEVITSFIIRVSGSKLLLLHSAVPI